VSGETSKGIGGGWRQGRVLSRQQHRIGTQSLRCWSQRQRSCRIRCHPPTGAAVHTGSQRCAGV